MVILLFQTSHSHPTSFLKLHIDNTNFLRASACKSETKLCENIKMKLNYIKL